MSNLTVESKFWKRFDSYKVIDRIWCLKVDCRQLYKALPNINGSISDKCKLIVEYLAFNMKIRLKIAVPHPRSSTLISSLY